MDWNQSTLPKAYLASKRLSEQKVDRCYHCFVPLLLFIRTKIFFMIY